MSGYNENENEKVSPGEEDYPVAENNAVLEKVGSESSGSSVENHTRYEPRDEPEKTDSKGLRKTEKKDKKKDKKKKNKKKGEKDKEEETDPFEHLPEEEAAILRHQIHIEPPKVTYATLYRYSTKKDLCLLFVGYVCSAISGAMLPLFTIIFGTLTNVFNDYFTSPTPDPDHFQSEINDKTLFYVYLGVATLVFTSLETAIHVTLGELLTARIRQHYIRAVLRQNTAYFDKLGAGEVTTRVTSDTNKIQEGISEKAGMIVNAFASFICAFVIGFVKGPKLAGVLMSIFFAILIVIGGGSTLVVKYQTLATSSYGEAATSAEETLSSVRNTFAFGLQPRLLERFDDKLKITQRFGMKKGFALTGMVSGIWAVIYQAYALGLFQGSRYVADGTMDLGSVITVIMSLMIGSFVIGNTATAFQALGTGVASATKVFEAIDRISPIDPMSTEGAKPDSIEGRIELQDVKFIYPSRPDVTVLPNFNLTIEPGSTVALVGTSGSGKSTIVGLIERFYDPVRGQVLIDGQQISSLNVGWLRQQVALVSQEPTLFAVSIYENICFGLIGTEHENADEATKREMVIDACRQANAWDFIQQMTDGLDTNVGDRGFLMSGGQKQRIAIARAIISNPKILLLDEATSALDTKSEGIVQEALDRAAKSRTTVCIAHRLSTIRDYDKIVVMSRGEIVEAGTHDELLLAKGEYARLVEAQQIAREQGKPEVALSGQDDSNDPDDFDEESAAPRALTEEELERVKTNKSLEKVATGKSISSHVLESQPVGEKAPKRSVVFLIRRLYQYNKREKWYIFVGLCFSLVCGMGYPSLSLLFAHTISAFMVTPDQYAQMRHDVNFYTGFFFMVGVLMLIFYIGMIGSFSIATERLVRNIRYNVFQKYLNMDIEFFDREENTTGALTATLGKDAQNVEGLGGATLGQVMQSLVTIVAGVAIGIGHSWKLGLVCTATVPILLLCGFLRVWILSHLEESAKKSYEQSASYACESISAIRTVASLTREEGVWSSYQTQVEGQVIKSRWRTAYSAVMFGCSQGFSILIMGLGFWYGSTLLKTFSIDTTRFFTALMCIIFGVQSAAQVFAYSSSMSKAYDGAQNVSNILDLTSEIESGESNYTGGGKDVHGDIEIKNVHFRYPTRSKVPVLRGLNMTIKRGQYVALVGSSGCGKSTTIQLLERFYDPLAGQVTLDGHDITSWNINEYRKQLALVQQEPTLYSTSIRENIMMGIDEQVDDETMYAAARKANIHDFIMSLPEGYETFCGAKGGLLSGGQKQRVAIARALVRNPKVLLLDEATSALDSESEKVVQAALDEASKGRTTIAVAHRISSIYRADLIYVFDQGVICEAGTHSELLAKKGRYFELVNLQSLDEHA